MNYAEIKYCDIANGVGVRTTLFVSGCRHHCEGCFNPVQWDFAAGEPFTSEVEERILESLEPPYVAGLTILGGEPRLGFCPSCSAFASAFPKRASGSIRASRGRRSRKDRAVATPSWSRSCSP